MYTALHILNRLTSFLVLSLLVIPLYATHIVGGSMTYRCLGGNFYEITLTVYTDCALGMADYDKPAWVGVFDGNNQIVDTLFMAFSNKIDTLEQTDPCIESLTSICYRVSQYREIIELPFLPGGYTLAYQRCCRNSTIVNIVDPLNVGTTYFVEISEEALLECQSTPVFKNDPPIFICVDQLFEFDHSAFYFNGDSVSYELMTPFQGGISLMNPQPKPAFPPPYTEVQWKPPYGLTNMIDGNPVLNIDPVTGWLVVRPQTIGQYVVGVRVVEYKDGRVINTSFRTFQFNVVACIIPDPKIVLNPPALCDAFLANFEADVQNAISVLWEFGDPNNPGATSTELNPSYAYSDTGTYTIKLTVNPGEICEMETDTTLFIQYNSIDICNTFEMPECQDSIVLKMADCSIDSVSPLIKWGWTVMTPDTLIQLSGPEQSVVFTAPAEVIVLLHVESQNGCIMEKTDTLRVGFINPEPLLPDTVNICFLEESRLNPNFNSAYSYLWIPDTYLLDTNTNPNPAILAFETTVYTVFITDELGLCVVVDSVELVVESDLPEINVTIEIPECVDSIRLFAYVDTIPPDITICWEIETDTGISVTEGGSVEVIITTSQLVEVCMLVKSDTCVIRECEFVQVNLIPNPNLADTIPICQGDTVELNPTGPPYLIYQWSPPDWLDDPQSPNPKAFPPVTTLYTLTLTDTIGLCVIIDSVVVEVRDSTQKLDFTWDILCDGETVQFFNQSVNVPSVYWDFGDPSTTEDNSYENNPAWKYPGPGTYIVTIISPEGQVCPQEDTIQKELVLEEPFNEADFTFEYIVCSAPAEVQFFGEASSKYGVVTSWSWDFQQYGTSNVQNPLVIVTQPGPIVVTLIVTWDDLCTDTVVREIVIEFIDLNLPDLIEICVDSCYQVVTNGDPTWTYDWSPPEWMDDPASPNPLICPSESGIVSVIVNAVLSDGSMCEVLDEFEIRLDPCDFPCDSFPIDLISCLDSLEVEIDQCSDSLMIIWCTPDGDTIAIGRRAVIPMLLYDFVVLKKIGPFGYMEIDTIYINHLAYDIPVDAFADPPEIFKGGSSQLVSTSPFQITGYIWTPAESLDNPFRFNPVARPEETTLYTVIVTDRFGCTGTDTVLVTVRDTICEDPYIFVPNTFTPNNDGLNDILFVRGNYIDEMEFYIYNRWGELVFESFNKDIGWDGTFKGELLRTDVYGYYLKVNCFGGETFFKRGNVTLLRN